MSLRHEYFMKIESPSNIVYINCFRLLLSSSISPPWQVFCCTPAKIPWARTYCWVDYINVRLRLYIKVKDLLKRSETSLRTRGQHELQGLRPTIPRHPHPMLVALIEKCWHQDPFLRPEFSEILEILQNVASRYGWNTNNSIFSSPCNSIAFLISWKLKQIADRRKH